MAATVAVTGASGFIGKHLCLRLEREGHRVNRVHHSFGQSDLQSSLRDVAFVYHLAGVNRHDDVEAFEKGNVGFTKALLAVLGTVETNPVVVYSSSAHAGNDTVYGRTKKGAEEALEVAASEGLVEARIYRLPGVFGPFARPRYNSVVSTLAHAAANDESYEIDDRTKTLQQVYVGDVADAFLAELGRPRALGDVGWPEVLPVHPIELGWLETTLLGFAGMRETLRVPDQPDGVVPKLYATYLSYLRESAFHYSLLVHRDPRGSLAELLRTGHAGQIFLSRTEPGITRGGHYHDTKTEKFVVLDGRGEIRLRNVFDGREASIVVSGEDFRVVDIPPGWAHTLTNVGVGELVTLFWASEVFDPDRPDTHRWPAEASSC